MSDYRSVPEETESLPRGIKYIIGNEAAERFSYYGMRTILVVFMTKYLHYMIAGSRSPDVMSEAKAQEYYHLFVSATYFFPVLGSFLSDVLVGKYRTILWLSIVYCIGHFCLALMGLPGLAPVTWMFLGLFLISFGSGGIKPCVSAHVGDQFGKKNSHLMTRVFQWFYFSINFGSTASTWLTPILLLHYGPHVAFGIPGVLMALATLLFWMGRGVFIHVPPGGKKFVKESMSREGIFAVLKLGIIYSFVAVFWGLFDQTGSSWVIQAQDMDRRFMGVEWLESQIQVLNPILVMILIPLFQLVVYPGVNQFFKLTAIRKISIGLFLTVGSFWVVAHAQSLIDSGQTPSIAWQLLAYVLLTSGEVMISITGLEFSYTQAPKTMKSVVMALWLFSVSLGNLFTSAVNHAIQTPGVGEVVAEINSSTGVGRTVTGGWVYSVENRDWAADPADEESAEAAEPSDEGDDSLPDDGAAVPEESTPAKGLTVVLFGADNKQGSADDIRILFKESEGNMVRDRMITPDDDVLRQASADIEKAFMDSETDDANKKLPSTVDGQKLIDEYKDSRGEKLTYKLVSKDLYRITSMGGDGKPQTQWDIVLKGQVSRAAKKDPSKGGEEKPYNWLEKRMIEAGEKNAVDKARGEIAETNIDTPITVGGQDTLEGADYFNFWVMTVFVTAVLFVPVGYFYKEKSYIQSEGDESDNDEDGDVAQQESDGDAVEGEAK